MSPLCISEKSSIIFPAFLQIIGTSDFHRGIFSRAHRCRSHCRTVFPAVHQHDSINVDNNSAMKQLAIQAEMLAETVKLQKYANIPSLALAFNFSLNAMTNDFKFSEYRWTPYSYVALSLNIPIFAGGKRYQQIRQAKNQYQQVQLQTVDAERQLKIAIRQFLTTMETNMKSYYAAQDAVAAAQKGYDIVEKSYQVGRSTLIELNDAQLALTQARLAEYQDIELSTISIGTTVGFFAAPGELFDQVSVEMEASSPFKMTFTIGFADGDWKYFPYGPCAEYASYESDYGRFEYNTAASMMQAWNTSLEKLYANAE